MKFLQVFCKGLITVSLVVAACAEKPPTKVAHGEMAGLYKKSELLGGPHEVAKMDAKLQLLVKGAKADNLKQVSFAVSQKYLTMFNGASTADASQAVVQFAVIEHWDLARQKNPDGAATQFLVRDKAKHPSWEERAYIEIDPYDPKKIRVEAVGGTRQGKIVDKKVFATECFSLQDLPLSEVKAALIKTGLFAAGSEEQVCLQLTQTVLSVFKLSAGVKTLVLTYKVIDHLDADLALDSDGSELTAQKPKNTWDKRPYVHLEIDNPHLVEDKVGANALAKDLLAGEWVYTATVVAAHSENGILAEGNTLVADSRLRFEFSETALTAYKASDSLNASAANAPVLRYSAEQFDIEREKNEFGDGTNIIGENTLKPWAARRNFRASFSKNQISGYFNDLLGIEKLYSFEVLIGESQLVGDVDVAADLIAFETEEVLTPAATVGNFGAGETGLEPTSVRIRHSFMRVDQRGYTAKEYTDAEFRRFGFFRTTKYGLDSDNQPTDATLRHFVGRHDVAGDKKITFYLSKDYPERYTDETRRVVASWNDVLKAATGRSDDVAVLEENSGQDYGDPRHNMIVWIDSRSLSAPAGYGPSVADPATGEMISSKAYMYGDAIKWVRRVGGDYYDLLHGKPVEGFATAAGGEAALVVEPVADDFLPSDAGFTDALPRTALAWRQAAAAVTVGAVDVASALDKFAAAAPASLSGLVKSEVNAAFRRVVDVDASLAARRAQGVYAADRMQGCAYSVNDHIASATAFIKANVGLDKETLLGKLESLTVYTILLHEVGHNLGLRHNFHGSFDEKNFHDEYHVLKKQQAAGVPLPVGEYPENYRTSSIMDYNDTFEALAQRPGKYDAAAIKYVYGDLLEEVVGTDNDTGLVVTQDIKKEAATPATNLRKYLFCTDGHVDEDPTCNRFDRGVTVTEITQSLADQYDTDYTLSAFRRGRRDFTGSSWRVLSRSILPVRQVLDELIYKLVGGAFAGQTPSDPVQPGNFADYIQALNVGVSFFGKILSTVEPGAYHFDEQKKEFVSGLATTAGSKNLHVGVDAGKHLLAAFAPGGPWEGSEQVTRRGTEFDKLAVLHVLAMRGFPARKYQRASIAANYFNLAKDLMMEIFSKFMRDEFTTQISGVKLADGSYRAVGNAAALSAVAADAKISGTIKASTSLYLRIQSMVLVSISYNSTADRTFGDYLDFRIKGVDDAGIPEAAEKAVFTSVSGLRTYVVPQTADKLSVSFALAKDAPAKQAARDTLTALIASLTPQVGSARDTAFDKVLASFARIWQRVQERPLSAEELAAINGDRGGFLTRMLEIIAQIRTEVAGNEEVLALLDAEAASYDAAVAAHKALAAQVDEAESQRETLARELLAVESALLELQEIYKIFN